MSLIDTPHGEAINARTGDICESPIGDVEITELYDHGALGKPAGYSDDSRTTYMLDYNDLRLLERPFQSGDYIQLKNPVIPSEWENASKPLDEDSVEKANGKYRYLTRHKNPLWRPAQ